MQERLDHCQSVACCALRNKTLADLGRVQLSRREMTYAEAVGFARWRNLLVAERHDLDTMPLQDIENIEVSNPSLSAN